MDSKSSIIVTSIGCPMFCFLPEEREIVCMKCRLIALMEGKGKEGTSDHLPSTGAMEDFLSIQIQSMHSRSAGGSNRAK